MVTAHVLVFPWPQQGHINRMLHFATALAGAGVRVTFLHTDQNLRRLAHASAATSSCLRFMSVPDGLPDDHPLCWPRPPARTVLCSRLCHLPAHPYAHDEPVRGVPGMEGFLRRRDLPRSCRRLNETNSDVNPELHVLAKLTARSGKARALVLNTAASLERSALAHIAPHMRDVFAIGPLHAMSSGPAPAAACSLWREDDGCMAWLDSQADRSVVYVSLGSLAVISLDQFTEFLSGLVATGYAFLWVLRPDMVGASQDAALREATDAAGKFKARVVPWAPQRDVLRHRAVGCFRTHCGWNSTLEAISEGVPMVCWPFFSDQQINSRFVVAVWRTGLDMKDVCDRAVVEKMVREATESAEIRGSAQALARQVTRDIADGGSSATELERLVMFIRDLGMSTGKDRA